MSIEVKHYDQVSGVLIDHIFELETEVFHKPTPKNKLEYELSNKSKLSILIAYDDNKPIAYKIGFESSKSRFYSWIGGVIPAYRKQGLAQQLMQKQHEIAKSLGYKLISTQTDNSFKPMIVLNLKSGFEIRGTLQSVNDDHLTIIMEKALI